MKKVSVVVPAYNAHETLVRCLTSLVHQTLEDIEIIVVNDASTDDTWDIMQRCQAQFPDKVRIFENKVNMGPGGARNVGIDAAEGEYIGFCDSDDYVTSKMFELLYYKAKEKDADIVDSGFYMEANKQSSITTPQSAEGELDYRKRNILILNGGYLVTKIFKREIFKNPPVRMRTKVTILEDNDILKYTYLKADNIWTVREVLYCYCDTAGSSTKQIEKHKYYDSIYGVIEGTYNLCHDLPTYEECREMIEYVQLKWYSYGINRCLYDLIAQYGPGESNINKYFDNAGEEVGEMLGKLARLKNNVITCSYRDNKEVIQRIAELDLKIMEECDKRFK